MPSRRTRDARTFRPFHSLSILHKDLHTDSHTWTLTQRLTQTHKCTDTQTHRSTPIHSPLGHTHVGQLNHNALSSICSTPITFLNLPTDADTGNTTSSWASIRKGSQQNTTTVSSSSRGDTQPVWESIPFKHVLKTHLRTISTKGLVNNRAVSVSLLYLKLMSLLDVSQKAWRGSSIAKVIMARKASSANTLQNYTDQWEQTKHTNLTPLLCLGGRDTVTKLPIRKYVAVCYSSFFFP